MKIQINPILTIGSASFEGKDGERMMLVQGETASVPKAVFERLTLWERNGIPILVDVDAPAVGSQGPELVELPEAAAADDHESIDDTEDSTSLPE